MRTNRFTRALIAGCAALFIGQAAFAGPLDAHVGTWAIYESAEHGRFLMQPDFVGVAPYALACIAGQYSLAENGKRSPHSTAGLQDNLAIVVSQTISSESENTPFDERLPYWQPQGTAQALKVLADACNS
jgi:hypothetical protein